MLCHPPLFIAFDFAASQKRSDHILTIICTTRSANFPKLWIGHPQVVFKLSAMFGAMENWFSGKKLFRDGFIARLHLSSPQ